MLHFSWRAQQDLVFGIGIVRFLRSARRSSPLRLKPGRVNASRLLYPPFKSCYTSKQKEPPMVALFVWRAQQDLNLRPTGS